MNLEVVWTPPAVGASEPILKAFDETGKGMRKTYAYHRTADGRRYFLIPESEVNRQLVKGLGSAWALKEDVDREDAEKAAQVEAAPVKAPEPPVAPVDKRTAVLAELTRLGISHKANMKLETLVQKLPAEARASFL